jgi:transcriptional regulator with XRE-family HTH domain
MNQFSVYKLPQDILKNIAKKHRRLRKQKGLSQSEIAERSGVSFGSVKRFEQTGQIAFESLLKLGHVLGRLDEFETLLNPKQDNLQTVEKLFSKKMKG